MKPVTKKHHETKHQHISLHPDAKKLQGGRICYKTNH